ncbi:MAG TPA: phosphoglycerate mutase family protein [Candidatus Krumholzibacteria bacterium]|nr:phosphoglycerate mutase family protein [Candidatus Krumholzibacteria bacterium]
MINRFAAACALVASLLVSPAATQTLGKQKPCDGPVTTIIIVRHADRAGTADSLSAAGQKRAQDLAEATKMATLRAIYVSDTRRARDTALPAAALANVMPETYPAQECAALIQRILHDHRGQAVLVVGHSNTVPLLIAEAGGPKIADLDEKEFDGLFVVAVTGTPECGATLVRLQYGAPSP